MCAPAILLTGIGSWAKQGLFNSGTVKWSSIGKAV